MDRAEQKERLTDILDNIQDLKVWLRDHVETLQEAFQRVDDLEEIIYDIGQVDSWDAEELKFDILNGVFENSSIQDVYNELLDFQSELEIYMDEVSDNRREKIEERYIDLESVIEKFDTDSQEYDDIENVLEHIEEAEDMLRGMKK